MPALLQPFLRAVGLGFAVAAPLGPTGATAIRHGLASGARTAFWIGMGAALTDLVYILATYLGLTPLLVRLPWLSTLLYAAGALVLGRMGWSALRDAVQARIALPSEQAATSVAPVRWPQALLLGITITLANPATIVSWVTVGGAFAAATLRQLTPLSALIVMTGILAGSAAWFSLLALLIAVARRLLGRLPWLFRLIGGLCGLLLLGFAAVFLLQGIRHIVVR